MTLRDQLLKQLSTPAAAAASDEDTRRSVARALGCEPAMARPSSLSRPRSIALDFDRTIFAGKFTRADEIVGPPTSGAIAWLRDQLADGVIITIHTCRLTPINPDCPWPEVHDQAVVRAAIADWLRTWLTEAEIGALRWWTHPGKPHVDMYLDDKGYHFAGVFPGNAVAHERRDDCTECEAWRESARLMLGNDDAVRTAPDQQLRRSLTQLVEDQAHTIDVMAECSAAGDADGVRMHYQHHKVGPELSVEGVSHA